MKTTFVRYITMISLCVVILTTMLTSSTFASAQDTLKKEKLPPEAYVTKVGVSEIDNVLDPKSPNYDPSQRYGTDGTRFAKLKNVDKKLDKVTLDEDEDTHYHWGTYLYPEDPDDPDDNVDGVLARQKVSTTLTLENTNDTVYAPALIAPNDCRLESVASYFHNGVSTQRYWKVFDHYTEGFVYATQINATFCSRYANSGYVTTKIIKEGSYWVVYLFDWINTEWDTITTAYGDGDHAYGWDYWECYYLDDDWPDLPQLRSYYLLVHLDGSWYYSTSTFSGIFLRLPVTFPYSKGYNSNYYDWYVGP